MNSFTICTIALCIVAAQCALAQYGQQSSYASGPQRKMAPSAQIGYGSQQAAAYSKPAASYSRQQTAPAYQAPAYQAAATYAAPKPKYEEPYYPPMPFAWGYDINDGYGGAQFHKESGDEYGKRTGSYGYTDAYGIYRQVDYVADENGFRATVKTNEPGTANEAPADVEWHAYEPPSNHYAGQQQSYAASAPAPVASYSKPAPRPLYSAAARPSYSAPAVPQRANYQQQQAAPAAPAASYRAATQQQQYSPSPYSSEQSYSSSQNSPVYSKQAASQRTNSY